MLSGTTAKICLAAAVSACAMVSGCARSGVGPAAADTGGWQATDVDVLRFDDVEWQQLNPARGDQSPRAATLWGSRTGDEQTGFLVQFVDGFSSPPHLHNVTYRGVVISGLVHNDDPSAAKMWMPAGSFWTQPKGEVHITAAKGDTNIAYIEIDAGPYLVMPTPEAFDTGERPVNVDPSNIVWQAVDGIEQRSKETDELAQTALLWGSPIDDGTHGRFLKFPPGFEGTVRFDRRATRGVVIEGDLRVGNPNGEPVRPGSSFFVKAPGSVAISNLSNSQSTLYLRMSGDIHVRPH